MVLSFLLKLFYPPPASLVTTAMSFLSFAALTNAGWLETKGKHMQYSKLRNAGKNAKTGTDRSTTFVPSKLGMIVVYSPALLAGAASFFLFPAGNLRFTLLRSAVTAHFLKRVLEVLFVHKYSGSMEVGDMATISLSYFGASAMMIYSQTLMQTVAEPSLDLKFVGVGVFAAGLMGNFYHHYLLSKLRTKGDLKYKIPQGGLFTVVICPHYLFEIMGFWGISCISPTLFTLAFTLGTTFYLMGRSSATLKWYQSKFDEFPREMKALIPFVF